MSTTDEKDDKSETCFRKCHQCMKDRRRYNAKHRKTH